MFRIIIERRIMPGLEQEYEQAARLVMRAALTAPGFITGESLHQRDNRQHRLLITQWRSLDAWRAWQHSPVREQAMQHVLPLLTEDERVTVYEAP